MGGTVSLNQPAASPRGPVPGAPPAPAISVVCPTYNSRRFVIATLESVVAQTILPCEIVVSDDGSTDGTPDLVQEFLSRYPRLPSQVIRNAHRGPGAARNEGIWRARGEWISFIDSDDVWRPNKLEMVIRAMEMHPGANMFCHNERHLRSNGPSLLLDYGARFDATVPLPRQLYYNNMFSPSAVTCRRSLLFEAGLFDETLMAFQDYELWIRMSPYMRPCFIPDVLGDYCDRSGNITSGSYRKRWRAAVRVAALHRRKVTVAGYVYKLLRVTASFALQALRHRLR